jgi:hypothetical protein
MNSTECYKSQELMGLAVWILLSFLFGLGLNAVCELLLQETLVI